MVSRADADGSSPWPDRVRFVTQEGRPFAPAAEIGSADGDVGPFLIPKRFAADFLAARPGDSIVFVPGAVGGTSFWNHRWNPGDDLYDNLVALTTTVLAEHPAWRLRAMLFQGFETDAKNGMLATTFRRALDRFVRGVRADLRAARTSHRLRRAAGRLRRRPRRPGRDPRRAPARDYAPALHRHRVEPVAERGRRRRPALSRPRACS